MIELNVNFENLVHMDLEEAKKIVSHFDNECDCEDLRATINGIKYKINDTTCEYCDYRWYFFIGENLWNAVDIWLKPKHL